MRNWWVLSIFGILGATAVLNALVCYFALSSATDPIEDRPYERGLNYEKTIHELRLPGELGWRHVLRVEPGEARKSRIKFMLTDKNDVPVTGAVVRIMALRPSSKRSDIEVELVEAVAGTYVAESVELESGLWWFRVSIEWNNRRGMIQTEEIVRF